MQANSIPTKFPIPFANGAGSGYIRSIPKASQIGVTPGAASLQDGFPPLTFTAIAAGGVPVSGQDVNGVLNQLSSWCRWVAAGGSVPYDAAFQSEIGGYPKGARVASATTADTWWVSTADNNMTNPDAGGAGWVSDVVGQTTSGGEQVPMGGIIMWSGSAVPANYHLCDGTNGTPDLRDRFIVGAGASYSVGTVGGSVSHSGTTNSQGSHSHGGATAGHALTEAEMPYHGHSASTDTQGAHAHTFETFPHNVSGGLPANTNNGDTSAEHTTTTTTAGAHAHNVSVGGTGGNQAHAHPIYADGAHAHNVSISDVRPPFYALAFIMRVN